MKVIKQYKVIIAVVVGILSIALLVVMMTTEKRTYAVGNCKACGGDHMINEEYCSGGTRNSCSTCDGAGEWCTACENTGTCKGVPVQIGDTTYSACTGSRL